MVRMGRLIVGVDGHRNGVGDGREWRNSDAQLQGKVEFVWVSFIMGLRSMQTP
jgi:hypothetical protein